MKVTSIKASSRASVKVGDSYYTVEYCEEHSLDENDDITDEREKLWNTCNTEVDNQIEDILNTFSKKR